MRRFVQQSAEDDILRQFEWFAERGLPEIARRFVTATREAIDALTATPGAGSPKHLSNPHLAGLRSWPVKRFREFRVYYLDQAELLIVVRVLHSKRDIEPTLESQGIEDIAR